MPIVKFRKFNQESIFEIAVEDLQTTFSVLRQNIYSAQGRKLIENQDLDEATKIESLLSENYFVNTHTFFILRADQQLRALENDKSIKDALDQTEPGNDTLEILALPFDKAVHPFFSAPTVGRNLEEEWTSLMRIIENPPLGNSSTLQTQSSPEEKDQWTQLSNPEYIQQPTANHSAAAQARQRKHGVFHADDRRSESSEQAQSQTGKLAPEGRECCRCRWWPRR